MGKTRDFVSYYGFRWFSSTTEFVKSGNKTHVCTKAIILKHMCFINVLRRLNYLSMVRQTFR